MFLVTANKSASLVRVDYIGRVTPAELASGLADFRTLLAEMPRGFQLLVDLSTLETMEVDCAAGIGQVMDLLDQSGVGRIVRVIPDADRDIGFNILGLFHYPHRPQTITCNNLLEACQRLTV